jgi:hypothetical protein
MPRRLQVNNMNMIARNIEAAPASHVLASRAMLSRINVSQWTARKLDKKVTRETNAAHNAASDAGRYNKRLISEDALAKIAGVATEARTYHYAVTLPWLDDGARILPAAIYLDYSKRMREFKAEFAAAVAEFVAAYPDYVNAARVRLNGMFNAGDYPDARTIETRFAFGVRVANMPAGADFRADVGDAAAAAIRADIERDAQAALQVATRDAWQRVAESVGRMAERLAAYKPATEAERAQGVFRDSLVENVRELVAILPALNIAQDPELTRIAERMARDLCGNDASALRDDNEARETTAKAAAEIVAQVSAYI